MTVIRFDHRRYGRTKMTHLIKRDLPREFPSFSLFGVIISDIDQKDVNWDRHSFIELYYQKVRKKYLTVSLGEDPTLKLYRQFYWKVIKVDPTKQRPVSEVLARRFIRRKDLPMINPVVDIFNAVSAATGVAMCAYDFDKLAGKLTMTLSTGQETFLGIGMSRPKLLESGQLIIKDENSVVSLYPYRDANHTKITINTRNILLTADGVPGLQGHVLKDSLNETVSQILQNVGGKVTEDVKLT